MADSDNLSGQKLGRWTVLDQFTVTQKGERKWKCRCECGTERYVLVRSLLHGGSLSCGCMRKESAIRARAYDLTGQTFGELTVLGQAEHAGKNGGIWWHCKCSCGEECQFPATLLVTGRRTHCSGKKHPKNYAYTDITGKRFGHLLAQYPVSERDSKGSVMWHFVCDCGNEVDVTYNSLVYSNQKSCGCKKKEHDNILSNLQTRVDGTSLDIIKSKKVPSNNTTGVRGVYFIKGKYVAKVVFRHKAYYLGTYPTLAEAAEARKEGEEVLYDSTMEYHKRWQARAEKNPEWAAENPVQIFVSRENERLRVSFLPRLDDDDGK